MKFTKKREGLQPFAAKTGKRMDYLTVSGVLGEQGGVRGLFSQYHKKRRVKDFTLRYMHTLDMRLI